MKGRRNCRGSLGKLRRRRLRSRGWPQRPLALSPCATSRFVSQPPPLRPLQSKRCALNVIDSELFAVAVAEVEFSQVAVQVRLADVLVYAINAALQYREETFNGIDMHVVADIFLRGMVYSLMAGEPLADSQINVALVSPKM